MTESGTLTTVMLGLRLMSIVLSLAIITWWSPALWRVLAGRSHGLDAVRAIWVPLAFSILLLQARWLYPGLDDLERMRMWVAAQGGIAITLLAAIYYHGASDERFNRRRTMIVHVCLLATCIAFAAVVR